MHHLLQRQLAYLGIANTDRPPDVQTWRKLLEALSSIYEQVDDTRLYQALFDQVNDAVFLLDLDGKYLAANRKACEMLGYAPWEILQLTYHEVVAPEEQEQSDAVREALLAGRVVPPYERRFLRKDGAVLPVEINAELICDDHGLPLYIQSIARDITERKRAEAKLRESEQLYHGLFEGVDDTITIHDLESKILDVNEAACRRLGYSREELLRMKTTDLDEPTYGAGFAERAARQQSEGGMSNISGVHIAKDGRRIDIDVNSKLISYRGQPAVLAVVRDITALKQAEAALRLQATLVEQINDAIYSTDLQENIVTWNRAAVEMYGWSAEEAIGQFSGKMVGSRLIGEPRRTAIQQIRDTGHWQSEIVHTHKDGNLIDVHVSTALLTDAAGKASGFIAVSRDITERKRAEAERVELAAKTQAIETLRHLLSNISHDLRTPLSIMMTSLYLLRRKLSDAGFDLRQIEALDQQVMHMTRIMEDTMEMAKLDDQATTFGYNSFELNSLLDEALVGQEAAIRRRGHIVCRLYAANLPLLRADYYWMTRVARNLLQNAIHYTPDGGSITLRTGAQGDNLFLEISDTGIGIAPEQQPRIFDRFYRADDARPTDKGGTGLGLTIVKKIIEGHHGRIEVESQVGQGSTFRVWLPGG